MSGIEAVGLVLGAFPIVVTLFQSYKEGCKPVRHWLSFRKTFTKLENGIRLQATTLDEQLEDLLDPLVDTKEELAELVHDLKNGGASRNTSELEQALQRRLGKPEIYQRLVALTMSGVSQNHSNRRSKTACTDMISLKVL